jgi:hypothetical protein
MIVVIVVIVVVVVLLLLLLLLLLLRTALVEATLEGAVNVVVIAVFIDVIAIRAGECAIPTRCFVANLALVGSGAVTAAAAAAAAAAAREALKVARAAALPPLLEVLLPQVLLRPVVVLPPLRLHEADRQLAARQSNRRGPPATALVQRARRVVFRGKIFVFLHFAFF